MESGFKISYLLSRQTVEGDSYTNGKTATPPTTTADIGFGKGPPARARARRSLAALRGGGIRSTLQPGTLAPDANGHPDQNQEYESLPGAVPVSS